MVRAMNTSIARLALLTAALVFAFASVGCQTSKGLGKDVEKLGENIQNSAD